MGFFNLPKRRVFDYKPRHYDPDSLSEKSREERMKFRKGNLYKRANLIRDAEDQPILRSRVNKSKRLRMMGILAALSFLVIYGYKNLLSMSLLSGVMLLGLILVGLVLLIRTNNTL